VSGFPSVIASPSAEGRGNLILITGVWFIDEILRCAQDDMQVADVFFVILREWNDRIIPAMG
jgi:hypothetical protein